jgi:hypothetical protein
MRVSENIDESAEPWSFVGTGDGTDEFHILRAVAEKYDGACTLWFPKSSFGMKTGLSVFDSINVDINRINPKISTFLFLIDGEHVVQGLRKIDVARLDNNKIQVMIERRLSNNYIKIITIDNNMPDGVFMIKEKLGSRILQIYVIIQGTDLKIEEEISKLIELEKDIMIPHEKEHIRGFFKEIFHRKSIGLDTAKLIAESSKNNLQKSFTGLTFILSEIENRGPENN